MDSGLTENGYQSGAWKRQNYRRLYSANRQKKRVKIVRLGGKLRSRQLRIRVKTLILKLRLITKLASPLRLLSRLKGAYISMMLSFAGHVSPMSDGKPFCGTHACKGSCVCADVALGNTEFEKKLVHEMINSLVAM